MYPFVDHFLDANILVGSRVKFDTQYSSSLKYMTEAGYKRITSYRVYDESRTVLQRLRRLGNAYLVEFQKKFNTPYDPSKLDLAIDKFTRDFIHKLKYDWQKKAIDSFLDGNRAKIREIAMEAALGLRDKFDEFRDDTIKGLDIAIDSLDIDCTNDPNSIIYRYDICPRKLGDYLRFYPKEYGLLNSKIGYDPDIFVLLDCYYLKENHIKSNICLITEDREHLLSKKPDIEKILIGICIQPARFPCAECSCSATPPTCSPP